MIATKTTILVRKIIKGLYPFENIKILYTNADQLPIAGNEPDVIMITEVIPKHLIPSSLLHINDYTQYLNFDMESETLGTPGIRGTAIYVKNDIPSVGMKILDSTYKESIWVEILLNKTEPSYVDVFTQVPHWKYC